MQFIDLGRQYERIQSAVDQAIQRVLTHGQYIMGPEVQALEERLADYAGSKHCLCCSSGTDALMMVLMAEGIGPGDAVFTTSFSFFATAEVIGLVGATPVFCDICPETYNLDPTSLQQRLDEVRQEGRLTPRAVMVVDLFGVCADYDVLNRMAREQGLLLIQDGAQSFGAEYHGKRSPALAPIGATSFFPAKPLGCYGDGGAVFTEDDEQAAVMRSIRIHGHGEDRANFVRLGLNARMDTLQAAILIEKLKVYDDEIERRQRVAARYREQLADVPLTLQTVPAGCRSVYAQFCVESPNRSAILSALAEAEIPSAIHYLRPLHRMDAFRSLGMGAGSCPVAEAASKRIFALPFHPYLSDEEIDRIGSVVRSAASR